MQTNLQFRCVVSQSFCVWLVPFKSRYLIYVPGLILLILWRPCARIINRYYNHCSKLFWVSFL